MLKECGVLTVRRNDEGYAKYRNAAIGLFAIPFSKGF